MLKKQRQREKLKIRLCVICISGAYVMFVQYGFRHYKRSKAERKIKYYVVFSL